MDDRKLLELAAKAAGIEIEPCTCSDERFPFRLQNGHGHWNPLYRDGDALRLAVKLNMGISIHPGHCSAVAQIGFFCEERAADTEAATRRAIVCAAAEVGRVTINQPSKGTK